MRQEVYVKFAGASREGRAVRAVTSNCTLVRVGDTACNGGASVNVVDPKTFPSVVGLGLEISDQIGEYGEGDLMKIAVDIKNRVPHAEEAFHFVYSRMMGWQQ